VLVDSTSAYLIAHATEAHREMASWFLPNEFVEFQLLDEYRPNFLFPRVSRIIFIVDEEHLNTDGYLLEFSAQRDLMELGYKVTFIAAKEVFTHKQKWKSKLSELMTKS